MPTLPGDDRDGNAHPAKAAGWPRSWFHPVHGERQVATADDEAALPGVPTDWFPTAERADAARTQPEADLVIHKQNTAMLKEHEEGGAVRQSTSAQAAFDERLAGPQALPNPEMPELDEATGAPKAPKKTKGGEPAPEPPEEPAIKA